MNETAVPLTAQHPEHCHKCYRLIHAGETCYQTAGNAVLCKECTAQEGVVEVLDTIPATDDLAVEVNEARLTIRRGDDSVEVLLGEVRHLVGALTDAATRAVNQQIHGSLDPEEAPPDEAKDEEKAAATPDWLARILAMTDEEIEALGKESEGKFTEEQLSALGEVYSFLIELGRKKRRAASDDNGGNGHGQV